MPAPQVVRQAAGCNLPPAALAASQEANKQNMSTYALNKFVGQACISDDFRVGLMNGRRAELIGRPEFDLEPDEVQALLAIKADTFADFAAAVERLVAQCESRAIRDDGTHSVQMRWPSLANSGLYFQPQT